MTISLKPESRWYNRKVTLNYLNQFANPSAPLAH
jgi:hypothetical protein